MQPHNPDTVCNGRAIDLPPLLRPICRGYPADQMIEEKSFITCAGEWNGMTIPGSYPVCDSGFDSRSCNVLVSLQGARGMDLRLSHAFDPDDGMEYVPHSGCGFCGFKSHSGYFLLQLERQSSRRIGGWKFDPSLQGSPLQRSGERRRSQAEWQPAFNRYITGSNPVACI